MKKKYLNIYSIVMAGLLLSLLPSCKKWLNVNPSNQVRADKQFTTLQGFMDASFGMYQKAAGRPGYGLQASLGLLDVLAQRYENKTTQTIDFYGEAARYNYTSIGSNTQMNVRGTIENIWSTLYGSIAQANLILQYTDNNSGALSGTNYNIVKGEALGMRGFLHFDLLRLYAPAYAAGGTTIAIPYMKLFTVTPQAKLTIDSVLKNCEADLKEAETLLAANTDIDQIAGNQGSTSADLFLMYRQNHLNYWAVKATLARLYLYKNDKVNALKYATEVINSQKFRFIREQEIGINEKDTGSNMTYTPEHIFSFYVSGMKGVADSLFKSNNGDPRALGNYVDVVDLYSTQAKLNAIYETATAGYATDLRSTGVTRSVWSIYSTNVVYTKKFYADNASNVKQRLVPVLRLSEMYYIAAEASATPADGVVFLNAVRKARLIPELATSITDVNLQAELQKEYRKEFYGEGQLWFYYKRRNVVTIPDGVGNPMTLTKYTFPFPSAELEFGK
jgi:hypothetical protein